MPIVHEHDGLIVWTRREHWRGAMADALTRHTAPACADAGHDIEDVPELLGRHVNGSIWLVALGNKLDGAVLVGHSESFMFPERAALLNREV